MAIFTMELTPRFNETDAVGHISNTAIPNWFEAARTPIFKIFNPSLEIKLWNLIVASYQVTFKSPTIYQAQVTITTDISRLGNASFDLCQQCWQQDKMTAEAITSMVHYNYASEQSEPIPPSIRQKLLTYMD